MKRDIHPPYYENAKVTCGCGATFTVGSTVPEIEVEVCASCHPFYTGKGKLVDTTGRVERFRARAEARTKVSRGGKKARQKKEIVRRERRAQRIEEA